MALFTRKRTRNAIRSAKLDRACLIQNARAQAHRAGLTSVTRKDGSLVIASSDHNTHILVSPKVTDQGKLIPMITVMSEVEDPDLAGDSHIVELHTMARRPEDQLAQLIRDLVEEEPINNASRVA